MNSPAETRNYIAEFRAAFTTGIDSIVTAAHVYVDAIDKDPAIKDRFRDEFADTIPSSAWSGFEAVGRKWMHPKLLLGGGGRYSAKIKRLPYSDQEQVFSGRRYELLTQDGDKLQVDVREVTPDQAEQLFDRSHIRTPAQQKAYMEARKAKPKPEPVEVMPYTIRGGKVVFRRGAELTRQELKRLLQEM